MDVSMDGKDRINEEIESRVHAIINDHVSNDCAEGGVAAVAELAAPHQAADDEEEEAERRELVEELRRLRKEVKARETQALA